MSMATVAEALALGRALHQQGDLARAEPIYRQILAREPQNAEALNLLGTLALQTARFDEAVALLERSVAADPTPGALGNLGAAYRRANRPADAAATYDRAIAVEPHNPALPYNRGLALTDLGHWQDAIASYRRAVALNGNYAQALNNLGDLEREAGLYDDALAHLDRALAIDPNYVRARYNRSLVLLALGRLREGFAEYEWRLRAADFQPREFSQPKWDGTPLDDKTLLVYAEQGFGDALQFVRYLPLVGRLARRVIVEMPEAMHPLLRDSGITNLVPQGSPLPAFDAQISLASLPHVFGTTLETIPAEVPYLAADERLVETWRGELSGYDGFKVGIVWQGRPTFRTDRYRSIPLTCFAPLAEVPGVRLFSLQKGAGIEQISALQNAWGIVDLGSRVDCAAGDFRHTAAIMKNLDLVVSSDTACVHLAGALDVPVWVALRFSPDWRWLRARDDSPWYPSARLFRQPSPGDWAGVFRAIAGELRERVNFRAD